MTYTPDLSGATWRKSSYSDGGANNCVEVGIGLPGVVPVRDSKVPHGPVVVFRVSSWAAFVTSAAVRS
ncbi:DUF397 domain-containing protein [Streptomyces sp. DH24]|uniref:DUF397 domain-containing protein n=1 Tax=Streptomyces sp. DH24 TaxID=3040123 RepID=UPI0024422F82|nr:DUF397 domain-containing protein [Streptomyces sp. DH24]MDG9718723.1 DUF397 domain-containing protein [Streptomyces sp. DH24]